MPAIGQKLCKPSIWRSSSLWFRRCGLATVRNNNPSLIEPIGAG
jgi:hypothetical protein